MSDVVIPFNSSNVCYVPCDVLQGQINSYQDLFGYVPFLLLLNVIFIFLFYVNTYIKNKEIKFKYIKNFSYNQNLLRFCVSKFFQNFAYLRYLFSLYVFSMNLFYLYLMLM